jgi:hypothetical protein
MGSPQETKLIRKVKNDILIQLQQAICECKLLFHSRLSHNIRRPPKWDRTTLSIVRKKKQGTSIQVQEIPGPKPNPQETFIKKTRKSKGNLSPTWI